MSSSSASGHAPRLESWHFLRLFESLEQQGMPAGSYRSCIAEISRPKEFSAGLPLMFNPFGFYSIIQYSLSLFTYVIVIIIFYFHFVVCMCFIVVSKLHSRRLECHAFAQEETFESSQVLCILSKGLCLVNGVLQHKGDVWGEELALRWCKTAWVDLKRIQKASEVKQKANDS